MIDVCEILTQIDAPQEIVDWKVIGHRILFNNSVENIFKLQNRVIACMHPQMLYKINKKLNNSKK